MSNRIPFEEAKPSSGPSIGGLPPLQSLKVLGSLGQSPSGVPTSDIVGLIAGGLIGWYVAKRWPNFIIKWVGVIAGAELGIIIFRLLGASTLAQRRTEQ